MTTYRSREESSLLTRALKSMPVVVLSGMRQMGNDVLEGKNTTVGP